MPEQKPLFIPLKTEHYRAFESGDKHTEYRLFGDRWNQNTCRVGRPVVLSKGYGKSERIAGTVKSFEARALGLIEGGLLRIAIKSCYPKATPDASIACIGIELGTGQLASYEKEGR